MASSSSTSALSPCERLPDDLLLRVLEHVMLWLYGQKKWRGPLRGVNRKWRALHDGSCTKLSVRNGIADEVMHALCGRLPALAYLDLYGVKSLTSDGLRAVGGLTALTVLNLGACANVTYMVLRELRGLTALTELNLDTSTVTNVGLRELRGLTALTQLSLHGCTNVTNTGLQELRDLPALDTLSLNGCTKLTDTGLQHLSCLTALTELYLYNTSTTQAGWNALKTALPALVIR